MAWLSARCFWFVLWGRRLPLPELTVSTPVAKSGTPSPCQACHLLPFSLTFPLVGVVEVPRLPGLLTLLTLT